MMAFEEVCERLKTFDEDHLLDLLGVTSEELVVKFKEEIKENLEFFYEQVKEEEYFEEGFEE